jgi:hypothetical protein
MPLLSVIQQLDAYACLLQEAWLFITEKECVYCAVGAESLNTFPVYLIFIKFNRRHRTQRVTWSDSNEKQTIQVDVEVTL